MRVIRQVTQAVDGQGLGTYLGRLIEPAQSRQLQGSKLYLVLTWEYEESVMCEGVWIYPIRDSQERPLDPAARHHVHHTHTGPQCKNRADSRLKHYRQAPLDFHKDHCKAHTVSDPFGQCNCKQQTYMVGPNTNVARHRPHYQ